MRTFSIVDRVGDLGIAQYLDNHAYTFVNLKTGRLAGKEYRQISYFCDYPCAKKGGREHLDYYANEGFYIIDEDGSYRVNRVGEFIIEDEMYDQVFASLVENGIRKTLNNLDVKNYEPTSSSLQAIKAALNTYMINRKQIFVNVNNVSEVGVDMLIADEMRCANSIIRDKQEEYKEYIFQMVGDEVDVEDPKNPATVPFSIFDNIFSSQDVPEM